MTPKRLLILTLVLASAWVAYWGVAAFAAKRSLTEWLEARRAEGWQAEWSDISVAGFPNRIDRTVSDLVLANPQAGWVWHAPFFQILGLSYDRDAAILVWPPEQQIHTTTQKLTIAGTELRASVAMDQESGIETATGNFKGLRVTSDADWAADADEVRIAARPTAGHPGWTDIGVEVIGLRPPAPFVARLSGTHRLPDRFDRVHGQVAVQFSTPPGLSSAPEGGSQIEAVDIQQIALVWGPLELSLSGELTTERDGRAEGELDVTARNWKDILTVSGEAGLLTEAAVQLLTQGLRLISGLSGSRETLDIPITFRDGDTFLGPIRIAPAPILRRE